MPTASFRLACAVLSATFILAAAPQNAQTSSGTAGTVRGSIADPSGAAVPGASVTLRNPVSHYSQSTVTNAQGAFSFVNVPYNNYHLEAESHGFARASQDIDVRTPIALDIKISLTLGTASTSVTVTAEGGDLVETDPITHTDIDRQLFQRLPLESRSSELSSLVTLTSPGVAGDSNGLFHGLG